MAIGKKSMTLAVSTPGVEIELIFAIRTARFEIQLIFKIAIHVYMWAQNFEIIKVPVVEAV